MVVVLGHEVEVIDQPHRLAEPRVLSGAAKVIRHELLDCFQQRIASSLERRYSLLEAPRVVFGVVGPSIVEIGGTQSLHTAQKVGNTTAPQFLEVER